MQTLQIELLTHCKIRQTFGGSFSVIGSSLHFLMFPIFGGMRNIISDPRPIVPECQSITDMSKKLKDRLRDPAL